MATIISNSKVFHQIFKCFNCGRKTVTLNNSFESNFLNNSDIEDDDLNENVVLDALEVLETFQNDWQATCSRCGWSDN